MSLYKPFLCCRIFIIRLFLLHCTKIDGYLISKDYFLHLLGQFQFMTSKKPMSFKQHVLYCCTGTFSCLKPQQSLLGVGCCHKFQGGFMLHIPVLFAHTVPFCNLDITCCCSGLHFKYSLLSNSFMDRS